MACCEQKIIPFSHKEENVIGYSESMRAIYGNIPKVEVWYWDYAELKYTQQGIATNISMSGYPFIDTITVNHGGESTGIIKLS